MRGLPARGYEATYVKGSSDKHDASGMLAGWWKTEWRACEQRNTCSGSKGTLQANRYRHHGVTRVLTQGEKINGGEGKCGLAVTRRAMIVDPGLEGRTHHPPIGWVPLGVPGSNTHYWISNIELEAVAVNQSINQSKRKTSNANGQTNLGHKHKAPDHNHEATQPMVDLPHTS